MSLSVAYKDQSLMYTLPEENGRESVKPKKKQPEKSIYTIMREERFLKQALKKYDARIKEIQKYIPDWSPVY